VDLVFAGLLLTLALPLLFILAAIVKLDSEGPVLFRQVRMGRKFRRFQLFKLRTMSLSGDGPAYTLGADPRITRAGHWLRRLKLDELPQLLNVLRGDMSIVGPRPVIPELAVEFSWAYARLLKVRPGLTDPASVAYCNENEILACAADPLLYFKSVVTPDKIRISMNYQQVANSWSDLGVVLKTALVLLSPVCRKRFCRQPARQPGPGVASLVFVQNVCYASIPANLKWLTPSGQFAVTAAVLEKSRCSEALPNPESAAL